MNRFQRQELIDGWNQANLAEASVAVVGRSWLGAFLIWALGSLGIGRLLWFGHPRKGTQAMAKWLLSQPGPFGGVVIEEIPSDPLYADVLKWGLNAGSKPNVLVDCSDHESAAISREVCDESKIRWLAGGLMSGGWLADSNTDATGRAANVSEHQFGRTAKAMAIAALLADEVRAFLAPLPSDFQRADCHLKWEFNQRSQANLGGTVVLVGVGGIGAYAACLLAAGGHGTLLVDLDIVEESNRNRQGLYTAEDTEHRRPKAEAAQESLCRFFPGTTIRGLQLHVDAEFATVLRRVRPRPTAILSAVDNATTRLVLQRLGRDAGLPVIQAGTDVFSADCFTQLNVGPLLDDQLHGLMTDTASAEQTRSQSCAVDPSYVVPGMIAAAMMLRRFEQLLCNSDVTNLPPIRWRQGALPTETEEQNEYDITGIGGIACSAS